MDEVNRYDGLLLVNEHGNLYFLLHNFGGQIIPFKLEELKNYWRKKDTSKSAHQACCSRMQSSPNDSRNVLSQCSLKLSDFSTNYILHCSIHWRLSTYQVFFRCYFKTSKIYREPMNYKVSD